MKKKQLKSKNKSKFVVICGGDGSGKGTVIEGLKKQFSSDKVRFTREPGGSPYAEDIRDLMFKNPRGSEAGANTTFALFWAARADHMEKLILPTLAEGKHVITDRFDSCTFSYQIEGQKAAHLRNLFWDIREGFLKRKPDLYVFLDVDPAIGIERAAARRGGNYFDEQNIAFHKRVRNGYKNFFMHPEVRRVVIDANLSAPDVLAQVNLALKQILD